MRNFGLTLFLVSGSKDKVIDDFGVISTKRTFKNFSEKHRMIKLEETLSLSEGNTVSGKILIDWTELFEEIKMLQRKQDCLDCDDGNNCSVCAKKPKKNSFTCEIQRDCETCLEEISPKENYSTDINMLKKKPANKYHQILP